MHSFYYKMTEDEKMPDARFFKMLDETRDVHKIWPVDETETTTYRLEKKPVLESRLLDDMQSLDTWEGVTPYVELSVSDEVLFEGKKTLKMVSVANLPDWLPGRTRGRIYCEPSALRKFDREDWTAWNRLSVWIYPRIHGVKSIVLRLQLHNDGELKSPDRWERTGAHNVQLKPYQWNHVTLEIPLVPRDCVTGVSIDYDMVGHENDADSIFTWFIAKLELQKVDADVDEGWVPGKGVMAISGSGYTPYGIKYAVSAPLSCDTFRIVETLTGREVFRGPVQRTDIRGSIVSVMDFSALTKEGDYILIAGDLSSRTIHIDKDVWEPSVWKVLNFYLSQRCGYEVKGKHRACHHDMLLKHGMKDLSIVCDGGWHDAADLAQGMANTADGTAALFLLVDSLKNRRDRLYSRVLEEAEWGLDYVIKTRFGDGWRAEYSSSSIWTDGIIGNGDDIVSDAVESPYINLVSAFAESCGAYTLRKSDPILADHALKLAGEDFMFAMAQLERLEKKKQDAIPSGEDAGCVNARTENGDDEDRCLVNELFEVKMFAAATSAAAALVRAGRTEFADHAADFARKLIACQQIDLPDWEIPLRGFFYVDREHRMPWHHAHHSFEQYAVVGLEMLIGALPDHPDWQNWYDAVARVGEYYKQIAKYTQPYGMLPEGVYFADEAEKYPEDTLESIIWSDELCLSDFRPQVENGVCLDKAKGVYLRAFPVWFSFRGNDAVLLSEAVCAAAAARVTGDAELDCIVQQSLYWNVGMNPFAQSLIYGEGYNWTDEYVVQPGQTVGQMPVGIQSYRFNDRPWWPQVTTATYKEVWICPANKWMWVQSYVCLPACVSGTAREEAVFTEKTGGRSIRVKASQIAGEFSVELPAGVYTVNLGDGDRKMTLISGCSYRI